MFLRDFNWYQKHDWQSSKKVFFNIKKINSKFDAHVLDGKLKWSMRTN